MPRMREAMRSGWNHSSWSSFSPVEASLIGLPVTALTESAAPPRASPSSFVRTTPSKATRSWNASRDVDRLLAGHRVEDEQDVRRLRLVADRGELVHQRLVDVQAAGGVDDHDVAALASRALRRRSRATLTGSCARRVKTGISICLPSCSSCSIAAGR